LDGERRTVEESSEPATYPPVEEAPERDLDIASRGVDHVNTSADTTARVHPCCRVRPRALRGRRPSR